MSLRSDHNHHHHISHRTALAEHRPVGRLEATCIQRLPAILIIILEQIYYINQIRLYIPFRLSHFQYLRIGILTEFIIIICDIIIPISEH